MTTLNVNELNVPIKRHRVVEDRVAAYKIFTSDLKTHSLKISGLQKRLHAIRNKKKTAAATLISDKMDFNTKTVKRDKEGHCIMIKGSI